MNNEGNKFDLEDELEMCADLKPKALFKGKTLGEYRSNINTATKHSKLRVAAEPFLLALPTLYIVEPGFNHAKAILTKQSKRLNLKKAMICD